MKDYIINSSMNKKTKTLGIELQGNLSISNIAEIKDSINFTIKNNNKIELNISDVDDADLTFIQLIKGLKQKYQASKTDFKINIDINKEISDLFNRAGFANTIN